MKTAAMALCLTIALSGCGSDTPGVPGDAQKLADTLSGDAKGAASDNPQCQLFTTAEIGGLAGEPVKAGGNAGGGLGCQWLATDGEGSVMVTVAPAQYHVETTGAPGYRPLPDAGSKGFVAGEAGGWTAGAIAADKALVISIDGSTATEANTIALLKQVITKVEG